ncbi:hypothetical protein [Actinomycetospora aeridis]|uniref:Uncharacterized protein n=1 Tax=Actinomycetospora aeridis TaxID=3129231 RepID=A0ABU8N6X3_9PSEU
MTNSPLPTAVVVRSTRVEYRVAPLRARHRAGPQRPAYRPAPWGGPELVTVIPPTPRVVTILPITPAPAARPAAALLPVPAGDPVFVDGSGRRRALVRVLGALVAAASLSYVVLVGCGALAGSPAPSGPRPVEIAEPATGPAPVTAPPRSLP